MDICLVTNRVVGDTQGQISYEIVRWATERACL